MSFGKRLTTLFQADAHGIVDAVEDRRLMLKQHLRSAEEELRKKRVRHESLTSERRELVRVRETLAEELTQFDEDIELAISGGKEELARFAIKKSLTLKQRDQTLAHRSEQLVATASELEQILQKQEREFDELKVRIKAHLARQDDHWKDPSFTEVPIVEDEDIELELLRRQKQSQPARQAKSSDVRSKKED